MKYTTGTQFLLSGGIVGTFRGFKETPCGLLLLFQVPGQPSPRPFSKFEVIKKV